MKKREIVRSNLEFNDIINNGLKKSNELFTIFYMDANIDKQMFGFANQKNSGNAVIRNKLRRQAKALVDECKFLFKNNRKYIIIIKKTCLTASYEQKLNSLKTLIGEINEK